MTLPKKPAGSKAVKKTKTKRVEPLFKKYTRGGRPSKVLTKRGLEMVEKLAQLQCTDEEIASVLSDSAGETISVDTLTREVNGPSFAEYKKRGMESGRASLRRWQVASAQKGNVTMQIWLGKQYLGQRDQQEVVNSGPADYTINVLPASQAPPPEVDDD